MSLSTVTVAALAATIVTAGAVLASARMPDLLVWAAFIGWASYDHSGANRPGMLRSFAGMLFGVILAWAVGVFVASGVLPLGQPIATAIGGGAASFVIVVATRIPALSVAPAAFYGFAAMFAYISLAPGAATIRALTDISAGSGAVIVSVSLLIGTGLGVVHGWLATSPAAVDVTEAPLRALRLDGSAVTRGAGRDAGLLDR
jgi:hypothetical protein